MKFKKLIEALINAGYTLSMLADILGCTQGNLSHIKNRNQEPKFLLGKAIIDLHERHFKKK
jgi:hypothetical protein